MKKLLITMIFAIVLSACSKVKNSGLSSLIISSESSVGIRAFQGDGVAVGKIVIQNISTGLLKNLQVTIFNAPAGVALAKGNCINNLEASKTCYFFVNYKPSFNSNKKTEQFITFLASAADNDGVVSQDSYTMVMQAFTHKDKASSHALNFNPSGNFIVGLKKGNFNLLYADSKESPGVSANTVLIRSTDGWHWSIVGANWNTLKPSVKDIKSVTVNSNNNLLVVYSSKMTAYAGITQYDGKQWNTRSLKDWNNDPKIKALLIAKDSKPSTTLITANGDLYVGFYGGCCRGIEGSNIGVLKYQSEHWELTSNLWPYGSVNNLRQFDNVIYAATDTDILKFDGKKWSQIGKNNTKECGDVLQTPQGDLYSVSHHHGVMKYDIKAKLWGPVGPPVLLGDGPGFTSLALFNGNLYVNDVEWFKKYNPKTNQWDPVSELNKKDKDVYNEPVFDDEQIISVNGEFLFALINGVLFRYDKNHWIRLTNTNNNAVANKQ